MFNFNKNKKMTSELNPFFYLCNSMTSMTYKYLVLLGIQFIAKRIETFHSRTRNELFRRERGLERAACISYGDKVPLEIHTASRVGRFAVDGFSGDDLSLAVQIRDEGSEKRSVFLKIHLFQYVIIAFKIFPVGDTSRFVIGIHGINVFGRKDHDVTFAYVIFQEVEQRDYSVPVGAGEIDHLIIRE